MVSDQSLGQKKAVTYYHMQGVDSQVSQMCLKLYLVRFWAQGRIIQGYLGQEHQFMEEDISFSLHENEYIRKELQE